MSSPTSRPTSRPCCRALQPRYDASLAAIADGPSKTRGIADGEQAAAAMLAARHDDGNPHNGLYDPFTPVPGTTPGAWRPTPPLFATDPAPWVTNVRPFLVPSVDMLRVAGPNPLTSRAYARDFNEIKSLGALHSTTRTPDETDAAIFWQENAYSLYNRIFRTLAADNHLSLPDSARMLAMTNLAGADAAIGCRHKKYRWNFWRPITAIREADTDGNPATTADPRGLPLFDPSTPVAAGGRHRWSPPRSPRTRRATSAPPARSSARCSTSSAATACRSARRATSPALPGTSPGSPTCCAR